MSSNYTSLMQDLDVAYKKVTMSIDQQEKKVEQEYSNFSGALHKDYSYMGLHCIGVMNLDFQSKNSVKSDLLNDLVAFNTKIYKTKIGLAENTSAVEKELAQFITQGVNQKTSGIYKEFTAYKKQFLKDISLYVKKNESLILPLVNKMKVIDEIMKKYSSLQKFQSTVHDKLFDDAFLKKLSLLQKKLRLMLTEEFNAQVKSKITLTSGPKIAKVRDAYLSDYDASFDALYPVELYRFDTAKFDDFLQKYYTNNQYQCSHLLRVGGDFDQLKRVLSGLFATESAKLTTFSNQVDLYTKLSSDKKELKKVEMVKKLKLLIDDFRGTKLRAALLDV